MWLFDLLHPGVTTSIIGQNSEVEVSNRRSQYIMFRAITSLLLQVNFYDHTQNQKQEGVQIGK